MTENKGKIFFIDTNIILDNPNYWMDFLKDPADTVVLTSEVWSELDRAKKKATVGHNARRAITHLELLSRNGDLTKGVSVDIPNGDKTKPGGKMILYSRPNDGNDIKLKFYTDMGQDIEIVKSVISYRNGLSDKSDNREILITHDKGLVVIARNNGLTAEHRRSELLKTENLYSGYRYVHNDDLFAKICLAKGRNISVVDIDEKWTEDLVANEYIIFANTEQEKQIEELAKKPDNKIFFRYDILEKILKPISVNYKNRVFGDLFPRNAHQLMLGDLLKDDSIPLVTTVGRAGTGKTLMCLAAAMQIHFIDRAESDGRPRGKIYVTRRDARDEYHGYLPGSMSDKISPLFQGIIKNYNKIARGNQNLPDNFQMAVEAEVIEPLSFGDITGLTLEKDDIWIIEECQNFEAKNMKKVISRVGTGAKIFVMGDLQQISNAQVREDYNGLNSLVDAITRTSANKEYEFAALLSALRLVHCERSPLADWATKYL